MSLFRQGKAPFISENQPVNSSNQSLPGDRIVRVYVTLSSGARIVVPINPKFTVAQLVAESIRRATALDLPHDDTDTILRLNDGSIVFGEDTLEDVLDLTGSDSFFLGPFQAQSQSSEIASLTASIPTSIVSFNSYSGNRTQGSKIHIRWITSSRALEHSRLCSLPPDGTIVLPHITLAELQSLALRRLFHGRTSGESQVPPNIGAELFLSNCRLTSAESYPVKLSDLKLEGTKEHPLDIFIVLVCTQQVKVSRLDHAFGFSCTNRAIATFDTCLNVFLKELLNGNIELDNMLEVIWEITHFPPAVIALRQLYENGLGKKDPIAYAVFASSIRELSLRMVPPWIAQSSDMVLESSRQIFSWLQSLSSEASKSADGVHQALVYKAEVKIIKQSKNGDEAEQPGQFDYDESVEIHFSKPSKEDDSKKILISKEKLDNVNPETLAAALIGSCGLNFYFNLPGATQFLEHRRVNILHPQDFDNLLQTTNQVDAFKMIGPLQLGQCTSSTLPVITLDSHGFVSRYDQKDAECGEREFFTANIIREEALSGSDPGQYLIQKLNPLVEGRKKEGTWETDAWNEDSIVVDSTTPEEAIVICVDHSSSMSRPMASSWMAGQSGQSKIEDLTRLSEVKELFKNLVARISAYRLPTHLGLVTFSGQENVRIRQNLTPVLYDFQDRLKDIEPAADTAIYDALVKATEMLDTFKLANPSAQCRIIVLTDGEDNSSRFLPENVCAEIFTSGIVLDAIVIGTKKTSHLFKMAKHTGGYAFNPQSRDLMFQIFLLDGCIDLRARPDIEKVALGDYALSTPKMADMQTKYDFPPCRPLPNESDSFISLQDASEYFNSIYKRSKKGSSINTLTTGSIKSSAAFSWGTVSTAVVGVGGQGRIFMNEVMAMINNPHPSMDVYASESNIGFWKVVMSGPSGSPYENGTFVLHIDIGDHFPQRAPTARFKTPVLHPNISKHGRICHEIFNREWHSGIHVYEVLQHIWSIFMSLEARDAVDPLFTLKYWTDPEGGRREVQEYVNRFALPNRDAHSLEILGYKAKKKILTPSSSTFSSDLLVSAPSVSSGFSLVSTAHSASAAADAKTESLTDARVSGSRRQSLLRRFSRNKQ